MLVHPDGPAIEIAENRMYGRVDVLRRRRDTLSNLLDMCELKRVTSGKLEIRTIQNPLTYEAVVVNPASAAGTMYLKHYVFKLMSPQGPSPSSSFEPQMDIGMNSSRKN